MSRVPPGGAMEAAEWLARLSDERSDSAVRREFTQWLTRSNLHVDEFLRVAMLARRLENHAHWPEVDLDELVAEARAAGRAEDKLLRFELAGGEEGRDRKGPPSTPYRPQPPRRFAAAIMMVSAAAALMILTYQWWDGRSTLATRVGEIQSAALEDGSIVQLDSRTRVRTRFTRTERRVELTAGEAIFKVAKDPARPFVVSTGNTDVIAIGTQFNVNARSSQTVVTVIEGRVVVSTPGPQSRPHVSGAVAAQMLRAIAELHGSGRSGAASPEGSVLIGAGEQVTVDHRNAIAAIGHVDPLKVTGWTLRRLYFEDTPVSVAAREFANYSPRLIRIDDANLGARRITGVFDSADPGALVQFLERYSDTQVTRTEQGWILERTAHR